MNILFFDSMKSRATQLTRRATELGHLSSAAFDSQAAEEFALYTNFDMIVFNVPLDSPAIRTVYETIRAKGMSMHARILVMTGNSAGEHCHPGNASEGQLRVALEPDGLEGVLKR